MNAINASQTVQGFGATANVQDTTTSAPSIVVFKTGALAPANSEYRAGLVDGSQQIYFVPQPTTNGVPLVTATNLEYGQNNEGWGLLTVYKSATAGPLLGGDDPCGISAGYSAGKGPDIRLSEQSLGLALPGQDELAPGLTRVRPGQRVKLRVSAFSPIDWAGFEHVTLFQGRPDKGGKVIGAAEIRGILKIGGGHDWITWTAPAKPGAYDLVARLQERWNDEKPGNNIAQLQVIVRPDKPNKP